VPLSLASLAPRAPWGCEVCRVKQRPVRALARRWWWWWVISSQSVRQSVSPSMSPRLVSSRLVSSRWAAQARKHASKQAVRPGRPCLEGWLLMWSTPPPEKGGCEARWWGWGWGLWDGEGVWVLLRRADNGCRVVWRRVVWGGDRWAVVLSTLYDTRRYDDILLYSTPTLSSPLLSDPFAPRLPSSHVASNPNTPRPVPPPAVMRLRPRR
jgi:hypothetical protein